IPSYIISPDMIALTLSLILIIISKLEPKEIIKKIDFELIFYLLGIFIIAGALEVIGVTELLGMLLLTIAGDNFLIQILIILWFSAFLSSSIDNIPITKVLIPVIGTMSKNGNYENKNLYFYSLAIGANWGDNLTPLGDNILVMNIAEQNKRPVGFKQFFKLGFITTVYQLAIVSIILILLYEFVFGLFMSIAILIIILLFYLVNKFAPYKIRIKINNVNTKLKNVIIK
ncbi:MAG: SLC13 family permease, partial [Promethearchaeota archaeon]